VGRLLELLLGPAATVAKQAIFSPTSGILVFAPVALWFIAHKDENFLCLSYGVTGFGIVLLGGFGWFLTRRTPRGEQ
jgi:hypothetical protein